MAEKRRISNPSTVLRTGIEQGILNDEVRRAEIGRTGNQGAGYQDSRVSGKRKKGRRWKDGMVPCLRGDKSIKNAEG